MRVTIAALLVGVGSGAWAALVLPHPALVSAGAGVGLAVGVVCAYLLVHQSPARAEPHRIGRRHLD